MPKSPRTFAVIAFCVLAAVIIAGGSVFYIERMNMNRAMTTTFYAEMLGKATFEYEQDHSNHYPDAIFCTLHVSEKLTPRWTVSAPSSYANGLWEFRGDSMNMAEGIEMICFSVDNFLEPVRETMC